MTSNVNYTTKYFRFCSNSKYFRIRFLNLILVFLFAFSKVLNLTFVVALYHYKSFDFLYLLLILTCQFSEEGETYSFLLTIAAYVLILLSSE